MPELPEVETVKNGIAKFIGCSKILRIEVRNRKLRQEIPVNTEQKLVGATIKKYSRIGKYIVIDLNNKMSIIWHLGMSGRIKTFKNRPLELEKHDHILIETDQGCLVYNDPRRFGLFTCVYTKDMHLVPFIKEMGLDPFDTHLDDKYLYNCLQHKKIPIKVALLDQKIITGIGNIYASEILYNSRILPLRPACNITIYECKKIINSTRLVLKKAIDNGGSTLRDYHKPDGSLGYFQNLHCVYDKAGNRCPDCVCRRGKIEKVVLAGRSTFYCPTLQK